jgi:Ca2+-binding RTX toxin-like protein
VDGANTTNDTVVGLSGSMTVNASSAANLLVFGPISGSGLDFIGGSGSATVVAHAGTDTVAGGTGPLDIVAGSGDTLTASGASAGTTLFGSANSDVTFTSGAVGGLTYIGLAGNETLNASGSSTNDVFWGGADPAGSESIVGGSGNDLFVAGQGTDSFGSGSGNNEFLFMNSILSLSGGSQTNVITNFLGSNNNSVVLDGLSTVSATSTGTGLSAATTVTLSDGTKIEFLGVSSESQLTGHIFSS